MTTSLASLSRQALLIRQAKVRMLQAKRIVKWVVQPDKFQIAPLASSAKLTLQHRIVVGTTSVQSHPRLESGKRMNLALAATHFDGRRISPTQPFSFWRHLGRPTRARGFLPGTEVRDGCVVPSIGGGLCLLSGALFRLAAELDWQILERHGHTVQGVGFSQVDATVFYPQVDLRFAPRSGASVLRVRVSDEVLTVEAFGEAPAKPVAVWRETDRAQNSNQPTVSRVLRSRDGGGSELLGIDRKRHLPMGMTRNCITCENTDCESREGLLQVLQ